MHVNILLRHKLHLLKRTTDESDETQFYTMEMSIDEKLFQDNVEDIDVGSFISFKYSGEYNPTAPPINPRISL